MMPIGIVLQVPVSLNRLSAEYVQCICMDSAEKCRNSAVEAREYRPLDIIRRVRLLTLAQAEETLCKEVSFSSKVGQVENAKNMLAQTLHYFY